MGAGASAAAVPANTSPVNVESEMEAVRLSLPNSLTEQVDALIEENSSSAPIPAPLEEPPTENKVVKITLAGRDIPTKDQILALITPWTLPFGPYGGALAVQPFALPSPADLLAGGGGN